VAGTRKMYLLQKHSAASPNVSPSILSHHSLAPTCCLSCCRRVLNFPEEYDYPPNPNGNEQEADDDNNDGDDDNDEDQHHEEEHQGNNNTHDDAHHDDGDDQADVDDHNDGPPAGPAIAGTHKGRLADALIMSLLCRVCAT
jgi:hypothetical protein